ncbi:hypothetical protein LLF88_01940 [bacterium]|nr:hypothetical protein [bacterium]
MYVLVAVLTDGEQVRRILRELPLIDVRGATVIESRGMMSLADGDVPMFTNLTRVLGGGSSVTHYTLFSVIMTPETLENAKRLILDVVGNIEERETGIMFVIRLDEVYGLAPALRRNGEQG